MTKNFKTTINGTGSTSTTRRVYHLRDLLCGKALIEFNYLEIQVTGTINTHLNFIKEGLLGYFCNQRTYQEEACTVMRNA